MQQRSASSPDRSTAIAFTIFASAAAAWIGIMALQPRPGGAQAAQMVMTKDIAVAFPVPLPHVIELADLSR